MFREQKPANFHIFADLNPDTGYREREPSKNLTETETILTPPPLSCFNYVWRWTQVAVKELVGLEVPGETGRILLPDTTWIFLKIIYLEQPEGNNQIII